MTESSYRSRQWTFSFRAWIDESGANTDRAHVKCESDRAGRTFPGERHPLDCNHFRLWDLNFRKSGSNIIRIIRRHRPMYLGVAVGPRFRTLKIGSCHKELDRRPVW